MRGQAALQGIYNPDRLKTPLLKEKDEWRPISFSKAETILKSKAREASQNGPDRVRMLTETIGDSLMNLAMAALKNLESRAPLVYEPYAYESLKTANEKVFGVNGLISYRMEKADILLSFGADFLETWLSPVEYAAKFKAMHRLKNGGKNLFFQVSPYQSLTGANADHWLACNPGSESAVALGLIRQALDIGKGKHLTRSFQKFLNEVTTPYIRDYVLQRSAIPLAVYEKLIIQLMEARKPLVLGTGTGASDLHGLQTNVAANLLNLLLDPDLELLDFKYRHRVEMAAKRADILKFLQTLKTDGVDLLLLNNVNPVFTLPPDSGVKEVVWKFFEHAAYWDFSGKKPKLVPFRPNRSKVADIIGATGAVAYLSDEVTMPTWLDGNSPRLFYEPTSPGRPSCSMWKNFSANARRICGNAFPWRVPFAR